MKLRLRFNSRSIICTLLLASLIAPTAVGQSTSKRSLPRVASRAEFDSIARVYHSGTSYALPHVLFIIDRKDKDRIYYANSKLYTFHKDFVNGNYLSLERGETFFKNNYLNPDRRFILGTLAFQTPVKRWTFEFWEGDLITPELIKLAFDVINRTFFERVAFKPNSLRQDEASASIDGIVRVLQSDIAKEQEYQPLNIARGIGRVHVIDKLDEHVEIGSNEILVLNEVPVNLPPVAGIITSKPSTPLSHINLLAKSWGIPNAYIRNAAALFREWNERWITFETRNDTYVIKRATNEILDEYQRKLRTDRTLMTPRADLSVSRLAGLTEQRARSVVAYGAKSANLGEVANARLPGILVPSGFTIPFGWYQQFMAANGFDDEVIQMLDDKKFVHDPAHRRAYLQEFRKRIQAGRFDERLRNEILDRAHRDFAGKGLFVRSSTNGEDLPNFSGAGLYTTMPNVRGDRELIEAIKTVWASIWNFEAYEARERAGIDHQRVYMAVLIQEGINSESSGVLITTDPFDRQNSGAIYISAKRGLGIRVVEGKRIAEQIIYRPKSKTVQVLTRSEEDSLLAFDESGGVKEVPISGDRAVLTDQVIRSLVAAAQRVERIFRGKTQDIEWAYFKGQIFILQSRPFVEGK